MDPARPLIALVDDEESVRRAIRRFIVSAGLDVVVFRAGRESLEWPGHDAAMLGLLAAWLILSRIFIAVLRTPPPSPTASATPVEEVVK